MLETIKSFPKSDSVIENFFIESLKSIENAKEMRNSVHLARIHRKFFSEAIVAVLRLPLTVEQYKHTLKIMHSKIIPFMHQPPLLMDFLTDSYNIGIF